MPSNPHVHLRGSTHARRWLAAAVTALVFLLLDAAWLGLTKDRLYGHFLAHLLAAGVNIVPAVLFYAVYPTGLTIFAVGPALDGSKPSIARNRGALLGLVAYATYDLSNQATLRDWPWLVTVCDIAWGTVASAIAAWLATLIVAATSRRDPRHIGQ